MKLIAKDKVFSLHSLPDGFLYSYLVEQEGEQITVGYKMVTFSTGKISNVTKNIYMLTKFGSAYKSFIGKIKNYLTCFAIPLESGDCFVIELDGSATLFGAEGEEVWSGKLLYKKSAPGGVAVNGNTIWISYTDSNVLIRYDLKTLRQELRIGGEKSPFIKPTGLFPAGSKIFICSKNDNCIWKMDCTNYTTEVYYNFDEPVRDYKFITKYEIVVLASGVYLL
ncbi:MAG: hypothetical protein IIW94_03695 [Clostridia bacterium]|nr:hypothetical protein [Clostridia bacterium]